MARMRSAIRAQMDGAAWTAAWAEGRAMTPEQRKELEAKGKE